MGMSNRRIAWHDDEAEAMAAQFEREEMAWRATHADGTPEASSPDQHEAERRASASLGARLQHAVAESRTCTEATEQTITISRDRQEEAGVLRAEAAAAQGEEQSVLEQEASLSASPRHPRRS